MTQDIYIYTKGVSSTTHVSHEDSYDPLFLAMKPYMIKTKSLAYEDPLFMLLDMEVKHIILYHTFVAKVNSHILGNKNMDQLKQQ